MTHRTADLWLLLTIVSVALIFIIIGPVIQIWAVNTLFKTNIEYSLLNWFCAFLLNGSFRAVSYNSK